MIPAYPTTLPPGDHDAFVLDFSYQDNGNGTGIVGTFLAATGYGNTWWALVIDGRTQQVFFAPEGGPPKPIEGPYADPLIVTHQVSVEPLGDWDSDNGIDISTQQEYFTSDKGATIEFDFDAVIDEIADNDQNGQFSNWAMIGLQRFGTCRPVGNGFKTRGVLDLVMSSVGSVHTITLSLNGQGVASGTITGNGSCTITPLNNSGVSGSVVLVYVADIITAQGTTLVTRWASSYIVSCGGVSGTFVDAGLGTRITVKLGPIAAGVQSYSITAVSDTGVSGTSATGNVTIPGRPAPPTNLQYVSGDWTNTVISFTASATVGATYKVYDSDFNGPTDMVDAVLSPGSGGTINATLPSMANAGTGIRRLVVSAVNAGVEDGQRKRLALEYLAGVKVSPRPNDPSFNFAGVTGGLTVAFNVVYDSTGEQGTASQLLLFIKKQNVALADGATPDATISLPPTVGSVSRGQIIATTFNGGTPLATGWYTACVRAATAGGVRSPLIVLSPEFLVSSTVLPAPGNISPQVVA